MSADSERDWADKLVDLFIDRFAGGVVELGKNRSRYGSTRALAEEFRRVAMVGVETDDLAAKALLEAEWVEHGGPVYTCSGCHGGWTFQKVHAPSCRVDAALTKLGYPDRATRDRALRELRDSDFKERWFKLDSAVVGSLHAAAEAAARRDPVPDSPTIDPDSDSDPDDGGD